MQAELAAFYHCWAAGAWREPTVEFVDALNESKFPGPLFVGLVGSAEQRAEARAEIERRRDVAGVVVDATEGGEPLTIAALHSYATRNHRGAVLYAHTKGAHRSTPFQQSVRRDVINALVLGWRQCLRRIRDGSADVAGLCFCEHPAGGRTFSNSNTWMASCAYVRTLPQIPPGLGRSNGPLSAEHWIGYGDPRVYSMPLGAPPFSFPVDEAFLVPRSWDDLCSGWLEREAENSEALLTGVVEALALEELPTVLDLCERALALPDVSPERAGRFLAYKAQALWNLKNREGAAEAARSALKLSPALGSAMGVLASYASEKGDHEQAWRRSREALTHGPLDAGEFVVTASVLAFSAQRLGRQRDGITLLSGLLRNAPPADHPSNARGLLKLWRAQLGLQLLTLGDDVG